MAVAQNFVRYSMVLFNVIFLVRSFTIHIPSVNSAYPILSFFPLLIFQVIGVGLIAFGTWIFVNKPNIIVEDAEDIVKGVGASLIAIGILTAICCGLGSFGAWFNNRGALITVNFVKTHFRKTLKLLILLISVHGYNGDSFRWCHLLWSFRGCQTRFCECCLFFFTKFCKPSKLIYLFLIS